MQAHPGRVTGGGQSQKPRQRVGKAPRGKTHACRGARAAGAVAGPSVALDASLGGAREAGPTDGGCHLRLLSSRCAGRQPQSVPRDHSGGFQYSATHSANVDTRPLPRIFTGWRAPPSPPSSRRPPGGPKCETSPMPRRGTTDNVSSPSHENRYIGRIYTANLMPLRGTTDKVSSLSH